MYANQLTSVHPSSDTGSGKVSPLTRTALRDTGSAQLPLLQTRTQTEEGSLGQVLPSLPRDELCFLFAGSGRGP